jgi:hypothetical protein
MLNKHYCSLYMHIFIAKNIQVFKLRSYCLYCNVYNGGEERLKNVTYLFLKFLIIEMDLLNVVSHNVVYNNVSMTLNDLLYFSKFCMTNEVKLIHSSLQFLLPSWSPGALSNIQWPITSRPYETSVIWQHKEKCKNTPPPPPRLAES